MNFKFWQKGNETVPPEVDDNLDGDDVQDDLEDIEPELRARFDKQLGREREHYESRLSQAREGLQQVGLDLSDDNTVTIRDTQRFTGYVSPMFQQSNPVAASITPEEDDEWADPVIDKDRFKQRLNKEIENATSSYKDHIKRLEDSMVLDKIEDAVNKVGDAVTKYAPMLSDAIEHPKFEEAFRNALSQLPMEQWRDSRNLVRVAAMLVPDLDPSVRPNRPAANTRNTTEAARATANRTTLSQSSPSRQSTAVSSAQDEDKYTDIDKATAEALGISVEMAASLAQPKDWDARSKAGESMFDKYRDIKEKEMTLATKTQTRRRI